MLNILLVLVLQDVCAVSRLDTDNFSNGLILATPNGLHIGCIRDVDRMHIRTVGRPAWIPIVLSTHAHAYLVA